MTTGKIHNSYDNWYEEIEQSIKKVTMKPNSTNTRRDITLLKKMRKILRKGLNQSANINEKQHLKDRIRIIK